MNDSSCSDAGDWLAYLLMGTVPSTRAQQVVVAALRNQSLAV